MAQDRNLPEGTDKIISGASAGGDETGGDAVIIAETTTISTTAVPAPSTPDVERPTGSTSGGGAGQGLRERMRSGSEKLSGQAAGKARDLVGQGLDRGGEALANVSRLVGDTATGLDERLGQEYGNYARRAAEAIESTAQSLRTKDPDELIEDTRNFVRKSPGVALAGAAILGFALARLVKTGFDAAREGGGDGESRGGGNA